MDDPHLFRLLPPARARNTAAFCFEEGNSGERNGQTVLAKKLQMIGSVSGQLHGTHQPAILFVEDDAQVRTLGSEWLCRSGYTVLEASSGAEAVRAFAQQDGRISLLVTDVDLAEGMSGRALAESMQTLRPALRVVLISGSPQTPTTFQRDWHFVAKPFAPADLLTKVEAALSEERALAPSETGSRLSNS